MKRLAVAIVISMLGILSAAAQNTSTQPIRGAELDAMMREMIEWINNRAPLRIGELPEDIV